MSEARAFDELRRYHTRPSQFNWGPRNVNFGKTHFKDPHNNDRILNLIFGIFTVVPKNGPKNCPNFFLKLKNYQIVNTNFGYLI